MAAISTGFVALRNVCNQAVAAGVVPGAVVLVADQGKSRFCAAFGARQIQPESLPATVDTIYDVASLTKAAVTSVLAMRAVAAGAIALDDLVARHVPEFRGDGKEFVTIRHLLCHASGLPPHRPFYERVAPGPAARAAIVGEAAREPLIGVPGARSVYSDLGFILLGELLERVTGKRLDVEAEHALFRPLGLTSATFVDLDDVDARARLLDRAAVAATQNCPVRGRVVLGEVDDLNAFAMGGIAGHAGLFSNADGLGRIAAALVAAWRGDADAPVVATATIREFWRPAGISDSNWRLGWDGPAAADSQAGARMSRRAVGHLGFTGCSLWIDPERALWIVLLTNRIHPTVRDDPRFRVFRAAVHDAALDGLVD